MSQDLSLVVDDRGVCLVRFTRPQRRNAFNEKMVRQLIEWFRELMGDSRIRVVVIEGEGSVFCAGGDIEWMHSCGKLDFEGRLANATLISDLFDAIARFDKPTIAVVQGAALGGATGIVACCDFAFASANTILGTTEVGLGIVPACLAPFLIAKIGFAESRKMFLQADRITAEEAFRIGLIHRVCPAVDQLGPAKDELVNQLLMASPVAQQAAKKLLLSLAYGADGELTGKRHETISLLADSWASSDGQEGMQAFLERRKPRWHADPRNGAGGDD